MAAMNQVVAVEAAEGAAEPGSVWRSSRPGRVDWDETQVDPWAVQLQAHSLCLTAVGGQWLCSYLSIGTWDYET